LGSKVIKPLSIVGVEKCPGEKEALSYFGPREAPAPIDQERNRQRMGSHARRPWR
jgi:hypothetical protein